MMIHQASFLDDIADKQTKISFIGMSGLGKSFWSKILVQKGYKRFCCDNMIADRLLHTCSHQNGKIGCLGQWMGYPFEPGYKDKEKTYLSAEAQIIGEIIAYIESSDPKQKVVIDTTGSAPYTGEATMKRLKELTFIIHLAVSKEAIATMLDHYIRSPRPVLWGNLYSKQSSETDRQALARSYQALLNYRETIYLKYAHCSVPYDSHHLK